MRYSKKHQLEGCEIGVYFLLAILLSHYFIYFLKVIVLRLTRKWMSWIWYFLNPVSIPNEWTVLKNIPEIPDQNIWKIFDWNEFQNRLFGCSCVEIIIFLHMLKQYPHIQKRNDVLLSFVQSTDLIPKCEPWKIPKFNSSGEFLLTWFYFLFNIKCFDHLPVFTHW